MARPCAHLRAAWRGRHLPPGGPMRTPASIARHPIHPMLVTFPIGLWIFSFVCGLIGALCAAIPGLIDLLSLPPEPRKTALVHMAINLTVVVLFIINIWLRVSAGDHGAASTGSVWLSLISVVLLAISGWLGGKMV